MLYNNLSTYFRDRYGKRIKKICIDGGFSCPNRDGKCGTGGCIFCGERGSGEHIDAMVSIREQVLRGLAGAADDDVFVAYFQNFSNTYADVSVLRARYDEALCDERIRALAIGTRADCIDEEKARLIAEYATRVEVWVELGLQSSSDKTAKVINRGYERCAFDEAVRILKSYGIPVVAHMIIGLPGEGGDECVATAKYISSLGIWGVKIHSLYVMEGTELAEIYKKGLYTPPTLPEYASIAAECIGHIDANMIIHRITGDCPRDMLIAPEWNRDKNKIILEIVENMSERGITQGSLKGDSL